MRTRVVYLIHFDRPYKHARHYLGSAADLGARLDEHRRGAGSRLMAVISAAGIPWCLARTWRGGRQLERRLKNHGGATRMCPICTPTTRRARLGSPQQLTPLPSETA
jgi:predicted GIY-YIG superfamily endonuclease